MSETVPCRLSGGQKTQDNNFRKYDKEKQHLPVCETIVLTVNVWHFVNYQKK